MVMCVNRTYPLMYHFKGKLCAKAACSSPLYTLNLPVWTLLNLTSMHHLCSEAKFAQIFSQQFICLHKHDQPAQPPSLTRYIFREHIRFHELVRGKHDWTLWEKSNWTGMLTCRYWMKAQQMAGEDFPKKPHGYHFFQQYYWDVFQPGGTIRNQTDRSWIKGWTERQEAECIHDLAVSGLIPKTWGYLYVKWRTDNR